MTTRHNYTDAEWRAKAATVKQLLLQGSKYPDAMSAIGVSRNCFDTQMQRMGMPFGKNQILDGATPSAMSKGFAAFVPADSNTGKIEVRAGNITISCDSTDSLGRVIAAMKEAGLHG